MSRRRPVLHIHPSIDMLPYLQLVRLPNLFTAFANITLGYLFVYPSLQPVGRYLLLLFASGSIYTAGMVWNDVFDFEQDLDERPDRPLPSGRVSMATAKWLGTALLVGGVASAWYAGVAFVDGTLRPGVIAFVLALFVLAYDGVMKRTWLGPFFMGGCRSLNVLLGMSATAATGEWLSFTAGQWCVALGIGCYVTGVTWFARHEARESPRIGLLLGLVWMVIGFLTLAGLPRVGEFASGHRPLYLRETAWWLLIAWLAFFILRRCVMAIRNPSSARVQMAVRTCILSLIMLDGAVCLAVRAPWWWAAGMLLLLVPTMTLGRWIDST